MAQLPIHRESKKLEATLKQGGLEICLPASQVAELLRLPPEDIKSVRLSRIMKEFISGFEFLKGYTKAATFFGSSRVDERNFYYREAQKLAHRLSQEGFAIITGGGPGIMEAANKGAYEAGGKSVGINIQMYAEQKINKYVDASTSFHYFFVRKVMLAFASEIYIFFPGGFGTLDEFFEIITLIQTKKIKPIPVLLVGKSYWQELLKWIELAVYEENHAIEKEHLEIYRLVDNADEAFALVKELVNHKS
ncbi:MAG: TIGR00730 family Rossman fold protein [Candidatus Wildermuthbacteria bacterium]|nr:TIGR00730 family Rossman fold protein [Candidatus Wildermuthbacteria bacterium]